MPVLFILFSSIIFIQNRVSMLEQQSPNKILISDSKKIFYISDTQYKKHRYIIIKIINNNSYFKDQSGTGSSNGLFQKIKQAAENNWKFNNLNIYWPNSLAPSQIISKLLEQAKLAFFLKIYEQIRRRAKTGHRAQ